LRIIEGDAGEDAPDEEKLRALPHRRPPPDQRLFTSSFIDKLIDDYANRMVDPDLAALFSNCYPNTLDTTLFFSNDSSSMTKKTLDTFVVTGDIDAMWLRDSTNQVLPYLNFVNEDMSLKNMLHGVINRQVFSVLIDAYANAFNHDFSNPSPFMSDNTRKLGFLDTTTSAMNLYLHERKYELDSLCAVMKLSTQYYKLTNDPSPFGHDWLKAMDTIVNVITEMQEGSDEEPSPPRYTFQRTTSQPTDTLMSGRGPPAKRTGMSKSPFRPSDDAATYLFPIAANAMAAVSLHDLASMLSSLKVAPKLADKAQKLSEEIRQAIYSHGVVNHPKYGKIFAYEVDGFTNAHLIDDANVPSLLSLPYLGFCSPSDPVYLNTRRFVLSSDNPYYSVSTVGPLPGGIGGPHIGRGFIWPMSIIIQGLTSTDDREITACLEMLKRSSAGTGFLHESFWKDDAGQFTRPWFAWANSLFGELILTVAKERPHIIFK